MTSPPARGGLFLSRNRLLIFAVLLIGFVAVQWLWPRLFGATPPDAGDAVIWHPSVGKRNPDGSWSIDLRGRVFEPIATDDDPAVQTLRKTLSTGSEGAISKLSAYRLRELAAPGLGQREIVIRYGLRRFPVGISAADGTITGRVDVPAVLIGDGRTWRFETLLRDGDSRKIGGITHLLRESGLSVISDIDHTLRLGAMDPNEQARRLSEAPHEAVPEIAALFRSWEATHGARFHYLADLPGQSFADTRDFLAASQFPAGSVHLRAPSAPTFPLIRPEADDARRAKIAALVERFPKRRFVLIGDTIGKDLETMTGLARTFPSQVPHVFLRRPEGAPALPTARYDAATEGLPDGLVRVFTKPATLPALQ